jgi:hypothetical protein
MRAIRATAAVAAGALALLVATPLPASPPTDGSGSGTIVLRAITESRQADGNVIQTREIEGAVTGTFDGTYEEIARGVIHKDGTLEFRGFMTFTGVAGDCGVGTVLIELEGRGVAGAPSAEGRLRVIDQGGNTVKVHGEATFHQLGAFFTYEGQFHCD